MIDGWALKCTSNSNFCNIQTVRAPSTAVLNIPVSVSARGSDGRRGRRIVCCGQNITFSGENASTFLSLFKFKIYRDFFFRTDIIWYMIKRVSWILRFPLDLRSGWSIISESTAHLVSSEAVVLMGGESGYIIKTETVDSEKMHLVSFVMTNAFFEMWSWSPLRFPCSVRGGGGVGIGQDSWNRWIGSSLFIGDCISKSDCM